MKKCVDCNCEVNDIVNAMCMGGCMECFEKHAPEFKRLYPRTWRFLSKIGPNDTLEDGWQNRVHEDK